jgi:hypothetical protein
LRARVLRLHAQAEFSGLPADSCVAINARVENSKLNKRFIAGSIGLTTIIVIGWISACDKQTETTTTDPADPKYWTPERIVSSRAFADAAAHGKVLIGMTAAYCQQAWGKPESVDRTTTANGASEWWWYGSGRALHLENGVLVSIRERAGGSREY